MVQSLGMIRFERTGNPRNKFKLVAKKEGKGDWVDASSTRKALMEHIEANGLEVRLACNWKSKPFVDYYVVREIVQS